MPRKARQNGNASHTASQAKYDAQNTVLNKTYGALADLRRELADTKSAVAERSEILRIFATCEDSQRAWLLLEDYFSKLALARKDFPSQDWWPRLLAARGQARLEELAWLFLRTQRPLPSELIPCANVERMAQTEQAEEERSFIRSLEDWMFPPQPFHLDSPRAGVRVLCATKPCEGQAGLHQVQIKFLLFRPRTGERERPLADLIDLATRAAHEQELFSPFDWSFIQWLVEVYPNGEAAERTELLLEGAELLRWLSRWGNARRLECIEDGKLLVFQGEVADLKPDLETQDSDLAFTHRVAVDGRQLALNEVRFFSGQPALLLVGHSFYLLRDAPPPAVLSAWAERKSVPVRKLSHRFLARLRKANSGNGADWERICVAHAARPRFVFELAEETVRLRLLAISERDQSAWQWNGHEWQLQLENQRESDKPEFLDDPRLEPATVWLRRLDWFTPEPGLWVGDAQESFLNILAQAWPERPREAEYLGDPAFQRLFLSPRKLKPHLLVAGSGIDWFSVSAEWEQEGLRLTHSDLERLATATGRFVKLPDSGWVELDVEAVQAAHEALADLGLESLSPIVQTVDLVHAAHLAEEAMSQFGNASQLKVLRDRVSQFSGIPSIKLPDTVNADMRPYQKEGFDFLCHLHQLRLGGILADDMGLGKTLQALSWLAWSHEQAGTAHKPSLVICPASVLHNWRREANRFVPHFRVLVLESGAERHNLRQQIPNHDLIVTNYALLRRDLTALKKFSFRSVILDEAQFIKNPSAQVTQSVKQLQSDHRLALTGTPLENRLLDLWSIMDFAQPGYLNTQSDFIQKYEPNNADAVALQIARRRLSAKLRPFLLRRLKKQVAKDLPDRIEERRDCELGEEQRKLYLAELRRSREQVFQSVAEQGLAKSKMHVLAALTRLRQICCHPQLVGSDTHSGKTETLFELLEPLLAEGQKVLVFSQFVQMLKLLEAECVARQIPTHLLTGATKQRQEVVQAFQSDGQPGVFLLSLRAAGTGLNLTSASYVVLYDPWWNPAVEAQAIDRSHRIGQTRTVIAYRLIAPGTVEEKIWELQQRKAQTITDVLGEEGFARSLSKGDLEYLFSEA
jgi:SNF2 family DNA or RNA helicase